MFGLFVISIALPMSPIVIFIKNDIPAPSPILDILDQPIPSASQYPQNPDVERYEKDVRLMKLLNTRYEHWDT